MSRGVSGDVKGKTVGGHSSAFCFVARVGTIDGRPPSTIVVPCRCGGDPL